MTLYISFLFELYLPYFALHSDVCVRLLKSQKSQIAFLVEHHEKIITPQGIKAPERKSIYLTLLEVNATVEAI